MWLQVILSHATKDSWNDSHKNGRFKHMSWYGHETLFSDIYNIKLISQKCHWHL
jgi:hypothetical protein